MIVAIGAHSRKAGKTSIVCALLREPLARAFTDDGAVIAGLSPFMLALALGQPFLQMHFTLAGVHRGAGDTVTPLFAAMVSAWGTRARGMWAVTRMTRSMGATNIMLQSDGEPAARRSMRSSVWPG